MDMSERSEIANLVDKISTSACERSFRIFFDRYYTRLFELALFYTKNQALAEEVISDVFLKVWNQRRQLQDISNIQAYLFVAVKRQALNSLRNLKTLPLFVHDLEHQTIIESRTPENILLGDDMLKAICQSVENLPEKCRMVYKLVKEEGLKYKEVAHLLDISEKTVEMHIGHALKKIRQDLVLLQKEPPVFPLKTSIGSALLWLITLLFF
ncbi:RNA polymerase sigma-70 factor [Catalinimonas niigatensis]|uniref:RNA polymerase sigma-70 factor n=1 Tax=Catalinimonas niigatensis TaxID=1397264 RepID=UPI0026663788|nr:RNA polymerase sigma-70 factor [Catalinimonas niigatensis]WPP51988.1 RNA polymerase sigma-70 factor [Catalinimonas niigatensis]